MISRIVFLSQTFDLFILKKTEGIAMKTPKGGFKEVPNLNKKACEYNTFEKKRRLHVFPIFRCFFNDKLILVSQITLYI